MLASGVLLSLCCIWVAFKNVPFSRVISYFIEVNYYLILVAVAIILFSFFLRAVRWHLLLSKKETLNKTFHILMTGFMLNCTMPGRIGEVARPVIISKNPSIAFAEALSTIAVERLFDLLMLLGLFSVSITFIHIPEEISYKFGTYVLNKQFLLGAVSKVIGFGTVLVIGLFLVLFDKSRRMIFTMIHYIEVFFSKISKKTELRFKKYCSSWVRIFIDNLAKGAMGVKNPSNLLVVCCISFVIWFLQICSYFIVVRAAGIDINFVETCFVMMVICFFISIPSVPGFWGVWEAGGVFAMAVLGISKADAAGFNLFNHAVQMLPVIIAGLVSAWFVGVSYKQITGKARI